MPPFPRSPARRLRLAALVILVVGWLWHGERLAYTLAALSALIALLGWYIADLIGDEDA